MFASSTFKVASLARTVAVGDGCGGHGVVVIVLGTRGRLEALLLPLLFGLGVRLLRLDRARFARS